MQWDFWTLSPESAHQITYLMGDRGIPSTWRHMNLYGSHTYMWINANGERFWVKYHFITDRQIEQGAWEPSNMVPDIGASPDKMLLGRMFAYADAHRYRIGANYNHLPVNAPHAPVHSYSTAGHMRCQLANDPVYAPNSKGGPQADTARYGELAGWHTDGDMVRTAYTLRAEDDDWGQAGTLVREVMSDAERERLVDNVVGHLRAGVSEPVLQRAFDYWRNIDTDIGDRIENVRQ
jgi:catalase